MPVSVHIPTKVRLDPKALFSRQSCLEEAFEQALGRALKKSREIVLAERGGYVGLKLWRPEFHWHGPGLAAVRGELRKQIENALSDKVREVVNKVGLYEYTQKAAKAPAVLPADISEYIDLNRIYGRIGLYEVPSYDGEGDTEQFPIDTEEQSNDENIRYEWKSIPPPSAKQVRELFEEAFKEWGKKLPPNPAFVGIVWQVSTGYALIFMPVQDGRPRGFEINPPQKLEFHGTAGSGTWKPVSIWPAPAVVVVKRFPAANTEDRENIMRRFQGAAIRQDLEKSISKGARLNTPEAAKALENTVTAEIKRRVGGFPQGTVAIAHIDFGSEFVLAPLPQGPHLEWEGDAYLLPVTQHAVAQKAEKDKDKEGSGSGPGGKGEGGEGGGGKKAAAGTGQETGEGEGGKGGFIDSGETGTTTQDAEGALFPSAGDSQAEELECGPFQDEPSLDKLGDEGNLLRGIMEEIAYALQMPMCDYAGTFCLNAAYTLKARANGLGEYAATGNHEGFFQDIKRQGAGNMGGVQFVPLASPALQLLRHLAGVTPMISRLSHKIEEIYTEAAYAYHFNGRNPISWMLHFFEALVPTMRDAVAIIFVSTCRVLMLQLLNSSSKQIWARLNNLDAYSQLFQSVLVPRLTGLDELLHLRDRLKRAEDLGLVAFYGIPAAVPATQIVADAQAWKQAQQSLIDSLATATTNVASSEESGYGEILRQKDDTLAIRGAKGRIWTLDGLEQAIQIARGTLEGVDPLIKQLIDLEDIMEKFRESNDIKGTLSDVLLQMALSNREITGKVRGSRMFAFRASKIHESLPSATIPGTEYELGGIHLRAHQAIGSFFGGDPYYAGGIEYLFGVELGMKEVLGFLEFTGIVLLSVICPPAGVAVGIATAAYHYEEAKESERIYQSLIDPELVITRAEVETQLFAARLGLALSFLPVAGAVGKGAASGVRVLATYGLEEGGEIITTSVRASLSGGMSGVARRALNSLTEEVAEAIARGVVKAFVIEMAKAETINFVISHAMQPVMQRIAHEVSVKGPAGGPEAVRRIIARVAARRAQLKQKVN